MLFWASEVTGESEYKNVALKHLHTAVNVVIRDDGSTHHTFVFNPETGEPERGVTCQGYSMEALMRLKNPDWNSYWE